MFFKLESGVGSAGYDYGLASDIRRIIAAQERSRARYLIGGADSLHKTIRVLLQQVLVFPQRFAKVGLNHARRNTVDSNSQARTIR
jgi:hypothetical protein